MRWWHSVRGDHPGASDIVYFRERVRPAVDEWGAEVGWPRRAEEARPEAKTVNVDVRTTFIWKPQATPSPTGGGISPLTSPCGAPIRR